MSIVYIIQLLGKRRECRVDAKTVLHRGLNIEDVQTPASLFGGETVGQPQ